ncbi:MAG: hypothetical protein O7E52_08670 [Candidatus Poribacteria bacterium]|nr:hypothetical protein [Candidatus Poribacteria bacterium]
MRTFSSAKRVIQSGRTEFMRLYHNPNTRFAMIGIIGAFVILGVTLLGLRIFGRETPVEAFVERWKEAIESNRPELYQALWDSTARNQNWEQHERALKLFNKEKVEADISGIAPRTDLRDENRLRIERIPVTLYQDGEILVRLFRDLTVEKKGVWQRWRLINDEIRDELEYPEATEEPVVVDEPLQSANPAFADRSFQQVSKTAMSQTTPPDVSSPIAGTAPLDAKLKLSQVVGEWQTAWQEKALDKYMSKYAEEAEITRVAVKGGKEYPVRLTKAQLREKMKAINKKYGKIEVYISNLQINGDNAVADVGFLQEFIGTLASGSRPAYSDYGTKRLIFMIDPAEGIWKIYSESWKLYKDVPKYPKL